MKKYRFCSLTAADVGENRHPETVIRELAPDARNLEPESVLDAWFFDAAPIYDPPKFITEFLPSAPVDQALDAERNT